MLTGIADDRHQVLTVSSRVVLRVHRSEIVLSVLVVVLCPHGVASSGFRPGELHVVLVVSLRTLRVPLLGASSVRRSPLLWATFERIWPSRRAGTVGSLGATLHG
jgi:hypothetical protein